MVPHDPPWPPNSGEGGARQICWILSGGACFAPDPEVVEAVAEDAAAQGGDGVDAVDGPMHAGAFASGSEDVLGAGLDDAGADAQTHGAELRILHAVAVAADVPDASAGLVAALVTA